MNVEAAIHAALLAVCPRVYPDVAKQGTARPYIVYQQVGGESPAFLERAVPSKENGRFQVTVWADTRNEAKTLSKSAEVAMVEATVFEAKPLGAVVALIDDEFDPILRGSSQDFTVWNDR